MGTALKLLEVKEVAGDSPEPGPEADKRLGSWSRQDQVMAKTARERRKRFICQKEDTRAALSGCKAL